MGSHAKTGRRNFREGEHPAQSLEAGRAGLGSRREVSVTGEAGK